MSEDMEMKDASAASPAVDATAAAAAASASPFLLLDSLPYLDQEYAQDAHMQQQVKQMLQEEMSTLTRTPEEYLQDFLQHKGYTEQFLKFETPLLTAAFDALASSSSSNPPPSGLDLTRYKLDPPANASAADLHAWQSAICNAQAQLEHQSNRSANLELLKKYGAAAWRVSNEQLTALRNNLATSLENVKGQIESLNRKRKSEQVQAGSDFALLENGYYSLIWKNHEIELACSQLQTKVEGEQTKKQQKL